MSGKLGLALMGEAMLRKSLIQFSEDGWGCVPSLSFTWGQAMVDVMKIMGTSLKRSHAHTATLSAPNPCSRPLPTHTSTRDYWTLMGKSGSFSYGVTAPSSWVLVCTRFCLCPLRVCFSSPV